MTRIGDPLLARAVVSQEQQALAVIVEPSRRIDALHTVTKSASVRRPAPLVNWQGALNGLLKATSTLNRFWHGGSA